MKSKELVAKEPLLNVSELMLKKSAQGRNRWRKRGEEVRHKFDKLELRSDANAKNHIIQLDLTEFKSVFG